MATTKSTPKIEPSAEPEVDPTSAPPVFAEEGWTVQMGTLYVSVWEFATQDYTIPAEPLEPLEATEGAAA